MLDESVQLKVADLVLYLFRWVTTALFCISFHRFFVTFGMVLYYSRLCCRFFIHSRFHPLCFYVLFFWGVFSSIFLKKCISISFFLFPLLPSNQFLFFF